MEDYFSGEGHFIGIAGILDQALCGLMIHDGSPVDESISIFYADALKTPTKHGGVRNVLSPQKPHENFANNKSLPLGGMCTKICFTQLRGHTMKRKLFKALPDEKRRRKNLIMRVTDDEFLEIHNAAGIRHLSVSEYLRRVALGRKADVTFEANIIVQLSRVVLELRAVYAATKEAGTNFPEEEWRPIIRAADEAIQWIGNL